MMKIVVFGADGKAGSAAVTEAKSRGHQVTSLDRPETDVTDPAVVASAAAGHDVAIMTAADPTADPAVFFRSAAESLVTGLTEAGVRRLVWMSLAALLPDADGVRLMDLDGFPAEFQPFSLAHRAALEIVRGSGLDWVAVSPSGNFDVVGEPVGAYQIKPGDLTASITYPDLARALIDEAERDQFRRMHIGVTGRPADES
ncbi:MAG: NAD(P)H-binding protein [Hamadaea sp.]|nr:NAD(P)H-binding protein [Hamadaea sp.]NUR47409.1 NAD(P)H-binding protein [Hamadaea sp.]NUT03540.1 NAD(P)H-binding protein [Hamadaea sp.]